jgi:TupA-like ATPgrasp
MRRSTVMRSRATDGMSASECQGKRPDQAVKHRSDGRECREPSTLSHLGFQPVQKTPTIHVSSGFIWGIPGPRGPGERIIDPKRDIKGMIRSIVSKIPGAKPLYRVCGPARRALASQIPPLVSRPIAYYRTFGRIPNLIRPRTFNEKVLYKSLFDRRPLIGLFADKYQVRDYVRKKLGSERHLIKLYGAYEDPAEIREKDLPNRFVMKPNHASGLIKFYDRDVRVDIDELKIIAQSWMRMNFYDVRKEWAYKHIKPLILIEEWLDINGAIAPPDFKFFCFHGEPRFVQVDVNRFTDHRRNLYDMNWNYIDGRFCYPNFEALIKRPVLFTQMREIAAKLSQDTDFVRVDLYDMHDRIYFSELTNYPEAGFGRFDPEHLDTEWGKLWIVPRRYQKMASWKSRPQAETLHNCRT